MYKATIKELEQEINDLILNNASNSIITNPTRTCTTTTTTSAIRSPAKTRSQKASRASKKARDSSATFSAM